jgi:sulfur-oxidizing protein SoxZ
MPRPLINVPPKAKKGEVVEIKILIPHPMESGQRRDDAGKPIPRDIINLVVCTYNDVEVFRAELFPAIAANPFLSFCTRATESGTLKFTWTDDHGTVDSATASIEVA